MFTQTVKKFSPQNETREQPMLFLLKLHHVNQVQSFIHQLFLRFEFTVVFWLYASDSVLGRVEKRSIQSDFRFVSAYGKVL
jgi:hypothetical protein